MSLSKRVLRPRGHEAPEVQRQEDVIVEGEHWKVSWERLRIIVTNETAWDRGSVPADSCNGFLTFWRAYMPVTMTAAELVAKARATATRPLVEGPEGAKTIMSRYPVVSAFLSLETGAGTDSRADATVLLFRSDGWWKLCLNDRAEGRSVWSQGGTLEAALGDMEGRLASGTAEWKKDSKRWGGKKGGG